MIEEQFVSFDTAKMLKEAGFDEVCSWAYYRSYNWCLIHERNSKLCLGYYSRPTQALAARWLRETHGIHVFPVYQYLPEKWSYVIQDMTYVNSEKVIQDMTYVNSEKGMKLHTDVFYSCEESLEAGLQEAIKLIKK